MPLPDLAEHDDGRTTFAMVTMPKVYFWGGGRHGPQYADGWVTVTFAAAVGSLDDLRRLCEQHQVKRPSKPHQSKPGHDEWKAAMARPGALVYRNEEPTGDETDDWQVLPSEQ